MSEVLIDVEDVGAPQLLGEGQKPPEPEPSFGSVPPQAQVVGEWTPGEVADVLGSVLTGGLMVAFVARRWELPSPEALGALGVAGGELAATGQVFAPAFNRWLPKSMGGSLVAAGAAALPALGELGLAIGRRAPLLAKPERPPAWVEAARQQSQSTPAPAPAAEASGEVFHLPPDLVPTASPLVGFGI